MTDWLTKTVQQAKDFLGKNYEKGTTCPCCNQYVKLYKRKLGSAQARALILLYNIELNSDEKWTHTRDITKEINITGDFAKLVHWKLIEEKQNEDTAKKNSGFWKLTNMGKDFVLGNEPVPSHVYLYNATFRKYSKTPTTIQEALGKHFNYEELMNT